MCAKFESYTANSTKFVGGLKSLHFEHFCGSTLLFHDVIGNRHSQAESLNLNDK